MKVIQQEHTVDWWLQFYVIVRQPALKAATAAVAVTLPEHIRDNWPLFECFPGLVIQSGLWLDY
eukprot:106586-Pelagomonas_calceolata.AAC.6